MSARTLPGTPIADALLASLEPSARSLQPHLAIVQVGDDAASTTYIGRKIAACNRIGMRCSHLHLPASTGLAALQAQIHTLNEDSDVSGIILQLPLPENLWAHQATLTKSIAPAKDVDGFTAYNIGKSFLSQEFEHLPCATPAGIILLLEHYGIQIAGAHVVIVGRGNHVGKPLAAMLLNRDATVTVCHSKTVDLSAITRTADILVSAVGKPNLITGAMVKPGAVVVDVGTTRTDEGLQGDIETESVSVVAGALTPVPGGVGPMTVASLLRNCVRAKQRQMQI